MIPPGEDGEFVARMEDVLDIYRRSYDPKRPQVCMDEQPVQLLKETRVPIPAAPGRPERYDFEYERAATAAVFLFTEALAGWRKVNVRDHRTGHDWAEEIRELLETDYPEAEKVILVCDNLNTHTIGHLYERFDAPQARRLAQRLEIHYTPKHGSWLNIAECELSALTRQALSERVPDVERLRRCAQKWASERNERQIGVKWRFTTDNARIRLHRLYPQIQMS